MSEHLTWTCCEHCAPHVNAEIKGRDDMIASLRAKVDGLVDVVKAKSELLACYRVGKSPSEKLWKRLQKSDELMATITERSKEFYEFVQRN